MPRLRATIRTPRCSSSFVSLVRATPRRRLSPARPRLDGVPPFTRFQSAQFGRIIPRFYNTSKELYTDDGRHLNQFSPERIDKSVPQDAALPIYHTAPLTRRTDTIPKIRTPMNRKTNITSECATLMSQEDTVKHTSDAATRLRALEQQHYLFPNCNIQHLSPHDPIYNVPTP